MTTTIELSDEELTALRVALAGLLINPGAAPYLKTAATGLLQRALPLTEHTQRREAPET